MIPQSEFCKRGNLLFLLVEGRYYTASNASPVEDNFIAFCGLRFPLTPGTNLTEEEHNYFRKNDNKLKEAQEDIQKEISHGRGIEELTSAIGLADDLNFFLTDICQADNTHLPIREDILPLRQANDLSGGYSAILPEILTGNYAVINKRVYPLKQTDKPSIVFLNEQNYTLAPSKISVEEVESVFQKTLFQQMKLHAIKDSQKVRELTGQLALLEAKNEALIRDLKIEKHQYCFECGDDKGFDIYSRFIYCPIRSHYNHDTGKSYGEGQSAATLPFSGRTIGSNAMFAERPNKESPLVISSQSHCLGTLKLHDNSTAAKMYYLRGFALEVQRNEGFHAPSQQTSYEQDYSYS
jgi:hypothetical protein